MKIKEKYPIMIFDNQCYVCIKFAKLVDFLSRRKFTMIGHYSDFGLKIRNSILDESALEMFWIVDKNKAYGGRDALQPLFKIIFSNRVKKESSKKIDDLCTQECKTVKAVFLRSSSLLCNNKTIQINDDEIF